MEIQKNLKERLVISVNYNGGYVVDMKFVNLQGNKNEILVNYNINSQQKNTLL